MKKTAGSLIQPGEVLGFEEAHLRRKRYDIKLLLSQKTKVFFLFLIVLYKSSGVFGQAMLELSASSVNTTAKGITTAPQTATFRLNTTGTTFNAFTPTTQVTFSLSNQQFTSLYIPGVMFGANSDGSGGVDAVEIWEDLDNSNTLTSHLTSNITNTAGSGISLTSNYGLVMFDNLRYPYLLYYNTNYTARPYYANFTIAFNRPVSNPIVHIVGVGGHQFSVSDKYQHGFYTEFELSDEDVAKGLTLIELSGNTYFDATTSNTKIVNSNTDNPSAPTSNWYSMASGTNGHGSSGSVLVNTGNIAIKSVTFKVFLKGMPLIEDFSMGPNVDITRRHWAPVRDTGGHTADKLIISASLPTRTITGTVFNDANGMSNNIIDGTATRYAGGTTQLYVSLVDNDNNVYASTAVSSSGTFTFSNVVSSAGYKLVLSTSNAVTTSTLPPSWTSTGEKEGSGSGSDGIANGILPLSVLSADVSTRFGIRNCTSPPTVAASAGRTLYCAQSATTAIQLSSTPSGGQSPYTYAWTGSGISNNSIQNPTATPTTTGSYTVVVTDALGCSASATTSNVVYENITPVVTWTCSPSWLRLNETNGNTWSWTTTSSGKFYPNSSYNSSQAATTSSLQQPYINVAGSYAVRITSVNGCTSTGTINVSATPAGCAVVLANELIELAASWSANNDVLIKWQTPLTSIDHFTIQRSTDGTNFTDIDDISSAQTINYTYQDMSIPAGCNNLWYRIKATDQHGKEMLSGIVSLTCKKVNPGTIFVSPNPVINKQLTLTYKLPVTGKLNYELFNIDGKRISVGILENARSNELSAKVIVLPNVEQGLYFLRVSNHEWISKPIKVFVAR